MSDIFGYKSLIKLERILELIHDFLKRGEPRMPKGKKKDQANTVKFIPMPRTWPGKISNEDLFAEFAQKVRLDLQSSSEYPLVTLRIMQLGLKGFHDFVITVPKDTTIYRLQNEIAKHQHGGAVFPNDVIIFKKEPENSVQRLRPNQDEDKLSIGVHNDLICENREKTLLDYFPDMASFKVSPGIEYNTRPLFLHQLQAETLPALKVYKRLYDFDQASDDKQTTAASKASAKKAQDYPMAYIPIYYDILPYITIDTYRDQFPTSNDESWMFQPVITSDLDQLVIPQCPQTKMDVHTRILKYSITKNGEKPLPEVNTRKTTVFSLSRRMKPVVAKQEFTSHTSKWSNSFRRIHHVQTFVDVTKKRLDKRKALQTVHEKEGRLGAPLLPFARQASSRALPTH